MALGPRDVALTEAELADVTRIETKIDSDLRTHQVSGYETWIPIDPETPTRIKNELISRYKKAGWRQVREDTRVRRQHLVFTQ